MKKQLFFDDSLLFGRDNVERVYGKVERIGEYSDCVCSTDYCSGNVFRLDNGKYRMLYFGHSTQFEGKKLFAAISDDGVNFVPESLNLDGEERYSNEIMTLPKESEVACIYEDKNGAERYIMLMAELDRPKLTMHDCIYTSPDLIHWTKKKDVSWGDGAEPLVSVYYNKHKNNYTIMQRPFWGIRAVGYKTTEDWESFTDYRYALGVDSKDEALAEIYGMLAFEYDGMYIGLPHMYRGLKTEYNAKYKGGILDCELAYSYDGEYWRRSLNTPFLTGGGEYPLTWAASTLKRPEDILIYGSASKLEHGPAFSEPGQGKILVYRLRPDGFIALAHNGADAPARVATREKVWHGGELHLNINAEKVRVGVYETCKSEAVKGNVLGFATPLEGYSADDCIPFSGDSTDFVPKYKSGKTLDALAGKTLVFEINYTSGSLYSLSGDYTDVFNTEGERYRKFGVLPKRKA